MPAAPDDLWFVPVRRPAPWPRRAIAVALLSATTLLALPSCQTPDPAVSDVTRPARATGGEPVVRVRIVPATPRVELSSRRNLVVTPADAATPRRILTSPVTVRPGDEGLLVTGADGRGQRWTTRAVSLAALDDAPIRCRGVAYRGRIVAHQSQPALQARLDVINHIAIESYLPGVLDRELFRHWHPNAFQAQAIAARSYAMHTMHRRRQRHFDVESTTADQAYGGMTANPNANDAVRATEGQVLTYDGHVLPAYYSSCCGGIGQDAAAAFPTGLDVPPLRGRKHGHWCRKSPYFRWGPVTRNKAAFERRLRAWGQARRHAVRSLGSIVSIRVVKRNAVGRASTVAIRDRAGKTFSISAESLRLAANFDGANLPTLQRQQRLPSAQFAASVARDTVRFQEGQGHGHGVGMCQYGSQAQALAGHAPTAILDFYYPGADIAQLY